MGKYFTIIICIFFGFGVKVNAQYYPNQSLYMFDKYRHNLAYAGFDGTLRMTGTLRRQWDGISGFPQEEHVNFHLPIFQIQGAAGLRVSSDRVGAHQDIKVLGTFNYVYDKLPIGLVSIGGGIGLQNRRIDGSKITTPDGEYGGGGNSHNDPLLGERMESFNRPIFSVAGYFANDYFDAGIQVEQLYTGNYSVKESGELFFDYKPTFSAFGQYNLGLTNELSLLPSAFIKTDLIDYQLDLTILAELNEKFYLGGGFRGFNAVSSDAVILILGIKTANRFDIYYSYDFTVSGLKDVTSGSHELIVSYLLGRPVSVKIPQPVIYNPRFF